MDDWEDRYQPCTTKIMRQGPARGALNHRFQRPIPAPTPLMRDPVNNSLGGGVAERHHRHQDQGAIATRGGAAHDAPAKQLDGGVGFGKRDAERRPADGRSELLQLAGATGDADRFDTSSGAEEDFDLAPHVRYEQ